MTIKDTVHDAVSTVASSGLSLAQLGEDFHRPRFNPPPLTNPCGLAPCEITGLHPTTTDTTSLNDILYNPEAHYVVGRTAGMLAGATFLNNGKATWGKAGIALGASATDVILDQTVFSNVKRGLPSTICDYLGMAAAITRQPLPLVYAEMVGMHALGKLIERSEK